MPILSARLRDMRTYIRKWRLLRQISNNCINSNSRTPTAEQAQKAKEYISKNIPVIPALNDAQLTHLATKKPTDTYTRLEPILDRLVKYDCPYKKARIKAEYVKIFDTARTENLVGILDQSDMPLSVRNDQIYACITGTGFVFSRVDSLIHEIFFKTYRGWITTGIAIIPYLIAHFK